MQELDAGWFRGFWYPHMHARGYDGILAVDKDVHESHAGVALFWKKVSMHAHA